jgi:hypothetical protein
MKFIRPLRICSLVLSVLFLSSCGVSKFAESTYEARDKDKKAFVQTIEGKIIEGNRATMKAPLFGKASIELDNETRIPLKEVVAYQDERAYYRNIRFGWAPRVKKGLINMYSLTSQVTEWDNMGGAGRSGFRTRNRTVYYLQKGDAAEPVIFSPSVTKEFVKDHAPSMEFINVYDETQKKVRMWSWINTTAVIGGVILAGTSIDNNTNKMNEAQGYPGIALLTGGLVNGLVNKLRRMNNAKNLELAIDTYNYQTVKKKKR